MESPTAMALDISVDGGADEERSEFSEQIEIGAVVYSKDEIEKIFDDLYDKLLRTILGDNKSLQEVKNNLNLVEKDDVYPVTFEWFSEDYGLVDIPGTVYNEAFESQEKESIVLTVVMKYQSYSAEYQMTATICAKDLTEEQNQERIITAAINQAEDQNREKGQVHLPDEINGEKVTYYYHKDGDSPRMILGLGAVAVIVLIYGEKQKNDKNKKYRLEQMKTDYTELITKMTLLVGAGMTIRRAWESIALEYQQRLKTEREKHFAYEEMLITLNEMKSGLSENLVYERFGQRCNIKEYLKFGALLQQNIRKGTKDLIHLLEQEALDAFEGRKKSARKKGEEAGTKLLLPMIMMLVVVMVIVMIPAMISFQM